MSTDHQNTKQKPSGKKAKKLSQKEQSERFIATARGIDADDSGDQFEMAVNRILPTKRSKDSAQ